MSTEIEDFIKANKKDFDTDRPKADMWAKIEEVLDKEDKKKKVNLLMWIGIAASVIVLMSITLLYISPLKKERVNLADVNPAYAKKQLRFASLIEEKRDSLEVFAASDPELYKKFNGDLSQLNRAYEDLKKTLPSSPNQQLVVKAMVKNLEIQLQLLNQQLSIISEVSAYKKENSI